MVIQSHSFASIEPLQISIVQLFLISGTSRSSQKNTVKLVKYNKMSRLFYIIGAIIAAISIVQAQLSKPALRNSLDAFWPQLQKKLRNPGYRIKQWPRGIIAQGCKDLAGRENLDPDVITTYEVLYGDVRCLFFFYFFFPLSTL